MTTEILEEVILKQRESDIPGLKGIYTYFSHQDMLENYYSEFNQEPAKILTLKALRYKVSDLQKSRFRQFKDKFEKGMV
jgi:hypothetical protein